MFTDGVVLARRFEDGKGEVQIGVLASGVLNAGKAATADGLAFPLFTVQDLRNVERPLQAAPTEGANEHLRVGQCAVLDLCENSRPHLLPRRVHIARIYGVTD